MARNWKLVRDEFCYCSPLQDDFVPLAGLETFCRGSLLYFPLFDDLSSDHITTTLSSSLQLAVFPAVALCDPALLEGISVQSVTDDRTELDPNLETVMSVFTGVEWVQSARTVLCDSDGDKGVQKMLAKNWRMLMISLSLALTGLQHCQLRTLSPLVPPLGTLLAGAVFPPSFPPSLPPSLPPPSTPHHTLPPPSHSPKHNLSTNTLSLHQSHIRTIHHEPFITPVLLNVHTV